MTHKRAPHQHTRAHALLAALQHGPATFYQLCERAGIDIEDAREEEAVHTMLGNLVGNGVCFDGLLYRLTAATRPAAPEECSCPSDSLSMAPHFGRHHHANFTHEREMGLVAA